MGMAFIIPNIDFSAKNYGKATLKSGETTPTTPTTPDTPSGGDTSTTEPTFVVEYRDYNFNSRIETTENLFSPNYGDWTLICIVKEDSTMVNTNCTIIRTNQNNTIKLQTTCLNNTAGTYANFPQKYLYSFNNSTLTAKGLYLFPSLQGTNIEGIAINEGVSKIAMRLKNGVFSHSVDGKTWRDEVDCNGYLTETDTHLAIGAPLGKSIFTATILLAKEALNDVSYYFN